jgi:hypothetical protein
MKIKELLESKSAIRDGNEEWDFLWDEDRLGFYVTHNGKELEFFKANGYFDRSGAQDSAQKLMFKLRGAAAMARKAREHHEYQYNKPLSDLEKEWVALDNRFMQLNVDTELKRWEQLADSGIIRKSLIDGSHPACTRKKS